MFGPAASFGVGELYSTTKKIAETNGLSDVYLYSGGMSTVQLYHADFGQLDAYTWVSIKEVVIIICGETIS